MVRGGGLSVDRVEWTFGFPGTPCLSAAAMKNLFVWGSIRLYHKIGDQIALFLATASNYADWKKNQNGRCYKNLAIEINVDKKQSFVRHWCSSVNRFWQKKDQSPISTDKKCKTHWHAVFFAKKKPAEIPIFRYCRSITRLFDRVHPPTRFASLSQQQTSRQTALRL